MLISLDISAFVYVHMCIYPPDYSHEHKTRSNYEQLPLLMNLGSLQAAGSYNLFHIEVNTLLSSPPAYLLWCYITSIWQWPNLFVVVLEKYLNLVCHLLKKGYLIGYYNAVSLKMYGKFG